MTKVLSVLAGLLLATSAWATASDDLGPSQAQQVTANSEARVNDGASETEWEFEWCPGVAATTAVSGKQYPAAGTAAAGSKALYCHNRSSATVYASFMDPITLTTNGATGYKFSPGDSLTWNRSSTTFGPRFRIAATAQTTSGACFWCSWLK